MHEEFTFEDIAQGKQAEEKFQSTKDIINEVMAKANSNTSILFMTAEGGAIFVLNYANAAGLMKMFLNLFNNNADARTVAKNADLLLSKRGIEEAMEIIATAEHLSKSAHDEDGTSDETIHSKYKELIKNLQKNVSQEAQK